MADNKTYEYYGYTCLNGSIICRGGNPDANNPEKINWEQIPNAVCSSIKEQHPDAMDTPKNCGSSSRSLSPLTKGLPKGLKTGLIIGSALAGTALIVGLAIHFSKKKTQTA